MIDRERRQWEEVITRTRLYLHRTHSGQSISPLPMYEIFKRFMIQQATADDMWQIWRSHPMPHPKHGVGPPDRRTECWLSFTIYVSIDVKFTSHGTPTGLAQGSCDKLDMLL